MAMTAIKSVAAMTSIMTWSSGQQSPVGHKMRRQCSWASKLLPAALLWCVCVEIEAGRCTCLACGQVCWRAAATQAGRCRPGEASSGCSSWGGTATQLATLPPAAPTPGIQPASQVSSCEAAVHVSEGEGSMHAEPGDSCGRLPAVGDELEGVGLGNGSVAATAAGNSMPGLAQCLFIYG